MSNHGSHDRSAGASMWTMADRRQHHRMLKKRMETLNKERAALANELRIWTLRLKDAEHIASGLCRRCNKPIAKGSTSRCEECLNYARLHERSKHERQRRSCSRCGGKGHYARTCEVTP